MFQHLSPPTGAFLLGIILHTTLLRHGEWDIYTTKLLLTSILIYALLYYGVSRFLGETPWQAFKVTSFIWSMGVAGIYSSMLVYRGVLHRLGKFPGPFVARLSNLYMTKLSIKKFHLFEEVQTLHQKYGDIVRIGKFPFHSLRSWLIVRPIDALNRRPSHSPPHP